MRVSDTDDPSQASKSQASKFQASKPTGDERDGTASGRGESGRGESGSRRPDGDRLDSSFRRLVADGISGLFESGAALRRGQEAVSEIASGTKEEVVRRVSTEVRRFLDRLDVTDLAQQVLEGMTLEVTTQVKFRRTDKGQVTPELDGKPDVTVHREPPAPKTPADPPDDV